MGADDYITKPFGVRELVARVRAVLRRAGERAEVGNGEKAIKLGDLVINKDTYKVSKKGAQLKLSATEFRLLLYPSEPAYIKTMRGVGYYVEGEG